MDSAAFIPALRADGAALAVAAQGRLDAPVPTCPGWTVADLVRHVGVVHRTRIEVVRDLLQQRPPAPPAPQDDAELVAWFTDGVEELARLLEATDPATAVWTFHPPDQTVGFWRRRMAHETAVHRVDAEAAAHGGEFRPVDAELAADGADEVLEVFIAPRVREVGGDGETLHLHATDAEGEWLLRLHPDRVEVTRGHAKGDAAARGTASDLLLWLWGRAGPERLEVFGDAGLLTRMRALAAQVT